MNCSQARAMLAIYRELNTEESARLDEHLVTCPTCKAIQAQYEHIGTSLKALPGIQPPAETRTKLMQALAAEHMRMIQRAPASAATPSAPAFLAPYLRELAHKAPQTDHLVAFSTADTGPLPALQQLQPRRVQQRLNHFAIIGIAAAILLTLMGGSLASLLLLSPRGVSPSAGKLSVVTTSEVQSQSQSVTMTYTHIASTVEVHNNIYYTTYSDNQVNWQLERFDEQTKTSTSLLSKPSTQELDILGSSENWLIWLQIDAPKTEMVVPTQQIARATTIATTRTWSLHALHLDSSAPARSIDPTATKANAYSISLIANKKFNPKVTPNWVDKPVQGIAFYQNMLLVAIIDEKGNSHLLRYPLDSLGKSPVELDSASKGHVLASPTANSDGSSIYWAEEWFDGKNLVSNLWTQQMIDAIPTPGRWAAHKEAHTYLFREDGKAFRPQIVADTLFILSTNPTEDMTPSRIMTASPTATAQTQTDTPTPTPTPQEVDTSTISGSAIKADMTIFKPQIDEIQSGKIFTFTTDGVPTQLPSFDYDKEASGLQGGAHFLLWLEDIQKVRMYDVDAQLPVSVGAAVPADTTFLAVNGDTAVAVLDAKDTTQQNTNTITVSMFEWPWSIKKTTKKA